MLHSVDGGSVFPGLEGGPSSSNLHYTQPSLPRKGSLVGNSGLSSPLDHERFEYSGSSFVSYQLEQHLALHSLVSDSAVIAVPQNGGLATATRGSSSPIYGAVPIAFVVLSTAGRDRASKGGDKESKWMKSELLKWLVDLAPSYKQMKGKLLFVECIPRLSLGSIIRKPLVDKAMSNSTLAPSLPCKGFFNTVLTEYEDAECSQARSADTFAPKKIARDSKRRATHSQIERRRREKINDRLITLRSIVPACAKELQDRQQQRLNEEQEAARVAAGGTPKTVIDAVTGKPKRKRNRKKPDSKKTTHGVAGTEEELGLHKLEVLTHAINHIFELKAKIHYLETGVELQNIPTAESPFGHANNALRDDTQIKDEADDELRSTAASPCYFSQRYNSNNKSPVNGRQNVESDRGEEDDEEKDEMDDDDDNDNDNDNDNDDDDYGVVNRKAKKHNSGITKTRSHQRRQPLLASSHKAAGQSARRVRPDHSSSSCSSRDSEEASPIFPNSHDQTSYTMTPGASVNSSVMKMSAESPIFLSDPVGASKHRGSQSMMFPPLPASAVPLPPQHHYPSSHLDRRESSSFHFKQLSLTSPSFSPFNQLSYSSTAAARSRSVTLSFPSYGAESEARDTPNFGPTRELDYSSSDGKAGIEMTPSLSDRQMQTPSADPIDASAAALLLNFSTSPEVLRPIGSTRSSSYNRPGAGLSSTSHDRPVVGLGGRAGSQSVFTSPQYRPLSSVEYPISQWESTVNNLGSKTASAVRVPGSAPGGTRAVEKQESIEELNLGSPSHLALDVSPEEDVPALSERGTAIDDLDRVSDATLEDVPLTAPSP